MLWPVYVVGWVWSPRSLGRTPRGAGWPMRSDPSASGAQPSRGAKWLLGAGFSFCKRMTTAPCNPFWWLWWLCAGMGLAPNLPRAYALGGVGGERECCFLQTVRKHSPCFTELPNCRDRPEVAMCGTKRGAVWPGSDALSPMQKQSCTA